GTLTGHLELTAAGASVGEQEFAAKSESSGLLTVPGVLAIVLLLVGLSFAESVLRPLRRGHRRPVAPIQLAVVGAVVRGLAAVVGGAVGGQLAISTLGACAVLGGATAVTAGIAATRLGRRRATARRAAAR